MFTRSVGASVYCVRFNSQTGRPELVIGTLVNMKKDWVVVYPGKNSVMSQKLKDEEEDWCGSRQEAIRRFLTAEEATMTQKLKKWQEILLHESDEEPALVDNRLD